MVMKKQELDMCNGPVFKKILVFTLPIILSGILQLLYNAADMIVVGRFGSATSLAAVGSTGSLTHLFVNLFMGLSVGVSVAIAHEYGAGKLYDVHKTVHTAIALSIVSGAICSISGIIFSKKLLLLMGTPDDVIDKATLYMRVIFFGMLASMIYNFGSAILRATGDSKRPLYFLTISGFINVILNLIFVAIFKMDVFGVALSTVISQVLSAALVIISLVRMEGCCKLEFIKIRIHKEKLIIIVKIGIPAGIQSSLFSISNVLVQSSVNSFGSIVMAGNTAAANIESFTYSVMNSVYHAALTFTSQNYGANKYNRIKKVFFASMVIVTFMGVLFGGTTVLFSSKLLLLYTSDSSVIDIGVLRLSIICSMYLFCGFMEVLVGSLRGIGKSWTPMFVSILGVCGLRIVWIYTVFASIRTLKVLYLSYPVSWFFTASVLAICFYYYLKKILKIKQAE